jgi:periplasmic protein TonB
MKALIFISLLFFLFENSIAQPAIKQAQGQTNKFKIIYNGRDTIIVEDPVVGRKEKFLYIEQMPEAPYSIPEYLGKNMVYPEDAKAAQVEGRVNIRFVVTETGEIDSPVVHKRVYPSLDKEALRLVSNMPPWKPGKLQGKIVRVWFTLPVIFRLE